MSIPKKKNNIEVNTQKELTERRQELLDRITKSDSYLPDSILHDDLDMGMLSFVMENLNVVSDGNPIPIIPKILTIQRWGEISNNWEFSDEDRNMKLPFIGVIRRPDVQPGSNPSIQRTIPNRKTFFYSAVKTWNGTQMGADIYKIPQPIAVDISFEIIIVCQKFRDLNRFNKIVLEKFASRQSYTSVKGHYVPIILDKVGDNSPIEIMDGRKFYSQSYDMTMLGFLIDSEEFEVKPAISRLFLLNEFMNTKASRKNYLKKSIETTTITFISDGLQTVYSTGERIGFLFYVSVNGIIQERDIHYYHIAQTSKITFVAPPLEGSTIMISYYKGKDNIFVDSTGSLLFLENENFIFDGNPVITVLNKIDSIIHISINGLVDEEGDGFAVSDVNQITLLYPPVIGSNINVCYIRY